MNRFFSVLLGTILTANVGIAAEVSSSAAGHVFNPTWSQDGRWVAFEVNDYEGTNDLYVVEMMSGQQRGAPSKAQMTVLPRVVGEQSLQGRPQPFEGKTWFESARGRRP